MTTITIAFIAFILCLAICIGCAKILRTRPGLRRRGEDPTYSGPPRRITDCSREIEEAAAEVLSKPANSDVEDDQRVKMQSSSSTPEGSK